MNPPKKATLYVTAWVTNRGIVKAEGLLRDFDASWDRRLNTYYYIQLPEVNHRHAQLSLGKECFLTLEEALADAEKRFKLRVEKARQELKQAKDRLQQFESGLLQIHKNFVRVSDLHPFEVS